MIYPRSPQNIFLLEKVYFVIIICRFLIENAEIVVVVPQKKQKNKNHDVITSG